MKNYSVWLDGIKKEPFDSLRENIEVDVLIIGGGITGISTLYQLCDSKLNVALVEMNEIGHGVTSRTTGKINYLQGICYSKLGVKASEYLKSQRKAIQLIKDMIEKEKIACDFENVSSSVIARNDKEKKLLKKEYQFLKNNGIDVEYKENRITVWDTYVFHPLKFLYGIAYLCKDKIYENTRIENIQKSEDEYVCKTKHASIYAKEVVLACHYPFFLIPYFMPIKCYQVKSYVMAKKNIHQPVTFITTSKPTLSRRYHKDWEITLIDSHNISHFMNREEKFKFFLDKNPEYLWSNEDIVSFDTLPLIGALEENLYIATGYNAWGMTNGVLAGNIIRDLILKKENPFSRLFDPHRISFSKRLKEVFVSVWSNSMGYVKGFAFKKNDRKFCPHMGCPLIYNEVEKIWECPCHASRFTKKGKCIKGPSKRDVY